MSVLPATTSRPDRARRERPAPERRKVQRRRIDGSVIDEVVLDPQIFGLAPNVALLHQVVTSQLAAARSGTQSTRTRAEVSGGGSKPFRQKGTGRARQGSIRAPQWAGGGVALGPKPRSYRQRTPKKMTRLALHCALSDRAAEARVALVEDWAFEEPKTRDARLRAGSTRYRWARAGCARSRRRNCGPLVCQLATRSVHSARRAECI